MEKLINEFLSYMKERKNASDNTILSYESDIRKFCDFMKESEISDISQVSETNLNTYILYLEKEKKASATICRNIASMKSFFLFLVKKRILEADPSERVKSPKIERTAPDILSIKELEMLFEQPDRNTNIGRRDRAMLELLYATGMRVSELAALKFGDLNLNNQFTACGESKKRRVVPIGRKAKEALKDYLMEEEVCNSEDLLFKNRYGQEMSRQGIWKVIKKYTLEANIGKKITPNTLRHTFTAHLLERGADIGMVEEMLGHLNISSSAYYHYEKGRHVREIYQRCHPRA